MSPAVAVSEAEPLVLDFAPLLRKLSDDDFFEFCQANRDWRFERTKKGEVMIMPPTGGDTGGRNFELAVSFGVWSRADATGKSFDSSTGFKLPDGADRSPDLAWVKLERWQALTDEQRRKFPPLCPDFVVEIRSATDSLAKLKEKVREYMDNGAQLGWLIDPLERKVYIYRPQTAVECLDDPERVSGEPLLSGFTLEMHEVWG